MSNIPKTFIRYKFILDVIQFSYIQVFFVKDQFEIWNNILLLHVF